MSASNATHLLLCSHCIGPNRRDYTMPCRVLKEMSDGRLKVEVYGDRYWKDTQHIRRVRYVPANRVIEQPQGGEDD